LAPKFTSPRAVGAPLERGGEDVLAGDELESRGAERALRDADGLGALLVGKEFRAVDRVCRHAGEQHVTAARIEAAGQRVQLVDRSHGLGGVAVLLEPAPRIEGDRP